MRRRIILRISPSVPHDLKTAFGVPEKVRDGVEVVRSLGERAEDGKVEDEDDNEEGDDVDQVIDKVVVIVGAAQLQRADSGLAHGRLCRIGRRRRGKGVQEEYGKGYGNFVHGVEFLASSVLSVEAAL